MRILFISDNRYPDGDAGAVRERMLARMLQYRGHEVYRVGRFCNINGNEPLTCYPILDRSSNWFIKNIDKLLFNNRVRREVQVTCSKNKYDAFLITGLKSRLVCWLKMFAKNNDIKLIYNAVELYSKEQFKFGKFSRHYINNHSIAEKIIDDSFSVICISSYLQHFYISRNVAGIALIPFVLDKIEVTPSYKKNVRTEIAYVGRPGRGKDYVKEFVESMAELTKDQLGLIHMTLVGITRQQLINKYGVSEDKLNYLGNSIDTLGVLKREKALKVLSECDFTILYRSDSELYAKAGFPTKVTESLMSGIPVITNLTSDLYRYINDSQTGYVIDSNNSIKRCFEKAIEVSSEKLNEMKILSRLIAEQGLDYRNYIDALNDLITQ